MAAQLCIEKKPGTSGDKAAIRQLLEFGKDHSHRKPHFLGSELQKGAREKGRAELREGKSKIKKREKWELLGSLYAERGLQ